jgi:hypothetical protein
MKRDDNLRVAGIEWNERPFLDDRQRLQLAWTVVDPKTDLLTHLRRSILGRSLARTELSLAVAFPSIIVVPIIAACACAHHAATGHGMVHGAWVVRRCWT